MTSLLETRRRRLVGATERAPHLRDALDWPRVSHGWLVALLPSAALGVANAGYQALGSARSQGLELGWRGAWLRVPGLDPSPESALACVAYGLACALPIAAVAWGVAQLWEELFARKRERPTSPEVPVVVALFVLMLPPAIPLWQVGLGMSFAIVVGLEIFGGSGRNVVHPALAGVAFLYFAYPASFSAETAWVAVEGANALPVLAAVAREGPAWLELGGVSWQQSFAGFTPAGLGDGSPLACLLGAALLVRLQLVSWRVIAGGILGCTVSVVLVNAFAQPERPLVGVSWPWHLASGSFAFGIVFLATDPVTSAATRTGRWIYGGFIGFVVVVVRVFNPVHFEGVLMAVLLGNVLAPLIDAAVISIHSARRRRRLG